MSYSRVSKFGDPRKKESSEEGGVALPFIVKNFLKLDGGELSGNLDLGGNFIKNLPDPVDGQDAVTKNYVDSSQGHSFFRRIPGQGYAAVKDLDMNENRLLNVGMPVDNREVSNKLYTDITANDVKQSLEAHNPFYLNTDKHKARGNIDMLNFKVEGLPFPVEDKDAVNKIYVDRLTEDRRRRLEADNPFSFDNGEFQAKNKIDMKGFKIENVGFPDLPEDVATVGYVDEANVWERKNGGFVAKDHIYLGKKKLGGLKNPTGDGEATNKKYVDEELKKVADEALKAIDEKTANLQPAAAGVDPAELDRIKTELEKNQPFNTRNQRTFNARGNINMKQKTLRNIPDPVELTDAVPLGFVNEMKEFFEDRIKEVEDEAKEAKQTADRVARLQPGGGAGNGNAADFGDMKGKKLVNVGDPENPGDGANRKYVDQKTPFTKTNGYYTSTHGINMDSKKITNLGEPTAAGDASNKKYVDDSINNIDAALLRRNGGFLAVDALDMNSNRIKNIGAPVAYDDVVSKKYVDEKVKQGEDQAKDQVKIFNKEIEQLKAEDEKRKRETDRIRVVLNDEEEKREEIKKYVDEETKKILTKERIYKFLGTSLILIRGEIDGPIIGIDEVKNINRRKPTINGGSISIDEKGNPIIPSIIYFGKNDGGEFSYDGKDGKIKIKPNFLFPYSGNIINCSYIFTYADNDDELKDENFEIIFRVTENLKGSVLHDPSHDEKTDYSNGIIDASGIKKEYKNVWPISSREQILKTCIHPPYFEHINFTDCASLIVFFKSSHPKVLKGIITLVVQIHLSNYADDFFPPIWNNTF